MQDRGNDMKTDEQNIKEIAMMSVFEVFEKMYYIFLEPRNSEASDKERRAVQIQFSGPLNGEMHAYYSEALAENMIENALVMEKEAITDQIMEDCLKESINMICGSFLQRLEPDKVSQLSMPRYLGKRVEPDGVDGADAICLAFESDGMGMDVVLRFLNVKE
jgi:CheY-specific phosphatase CheX